MITYKIAVYGSLKKGKHNHGLMENAKFIGDDTTKGKLYSNGSYPTLTPGENKIPVEIYEVDDNTFRALSRMEKGAGYEERVVKLDSGQKAIMWTMLEAVGTHWHPVDSY